MQTVAKPNSRYIIRDSRSIGGSDTDGARRARGPRRGVLKRKRWLPRWERRGPSRAEVRYPTCSFAFEVDQEQQQQHDEAVTDEQPHDTQFAALPFHQEGR